MSSYWRQLQRRSAGCVSVSAHFDGRSVRADRRRRSGPRSRRRTGPARRTRLRRRRPIIWCGRIIARTACRCWSCIRQTVMGRFSFLRNLVPLAILNAVEGPRDSDLWRRPTAARLAVWRGLVPRCAELCLAARCVGRIVQCRGRRGADESGFGPDDLCCCGSSRTAAAGDAAPN